MGCMLSRERGAIPLWPDPEINGRRALGNRRIRSFDNLQFYKDLLQLSGPPGPALVGSKGQSGQTPLIAGFYC